MRIILFLSFMVYAFMVNGQKKMDHTAVVSELAEQIHAASFAKVPVRLAVVTFVPVQGNAVPANSFGEYLTESIIGKLSTRTDRLKLFERKRMDAILKENEFMLSGMMKPSEALKIGELLPIDALFSGTYTKLKNYIDVTGRLIDVTSGEILMSYTGRIRLTKNIRTLFPETAPQQSGTTHIVHVVSKGNHKTSAPAETAADREARCRIHTDTFREKLHDLSTQEKVDVLVGEAMETPFEDTCGKLHYHLLNALSRYGLYPKRYQQFLLATLDTIAYPSGDDRAYSMLSYLTSDKQVRNEEWEAGLNTLKRVGDHTLSTYLRFLFNKVDDPDMATLQVRADEYFKLLIAGQIGLPRAIAFDRGFYEMMEALSANGALRQYVYAAYADRLATEPDHTVSSHLLYLKRMYDDEMDPGKKTRVINWIADYFNKHANKKSGDQLYDLARDFMPYPNDERSQFKIDRNREAALKYPARDLAVLVDRCRERFAAYAMDTPYPGQKESRIDFCVRNGIAIPGVIPTIPEAREVLKGNSIEEQHRVMKLLVQMGERVAPLEGAFIDLLDKKSLESRQMLAEVQMLALEMLGTLRTKDPKTIANMIGSLKNYDKTAEVCVEALVAIGKPAVNPLIAKLKSTTMHEGGLQYRLVVILGRIGKDAKPATPALRELLAKTGNKDIRYAIEATLQTFAD